MITFTDRQERTKSGLWLIVVRSQMSVAFIRARNVGCFEFKKFAESMVTGANIGLKLGHLNPR